MCSQKFRQPAYAAFKGYSLVARGMADEHLIVVLHQIQGNSCYEACVIRMKVKPHFSETQDYRQCQHVTFNILG